MRHSVSGPCAFKLLWKRGTATRYRRGLLMWSVVLPFVLAFLRPVPIFASEDRSYKTFLDRLETNRNAESPFAPGQHVTIKDRALLDPFLPKSVWEYYFFPDMDVEIAAPGNYPPPADWGKAVQPGYKLDDRGILVGFKGGGFPFPNIEETDPQAGAKVVWNMLWRPGAEDYVMAMVSWLRGEHGRLDRTFEYVQTNSRYALGDHFLVDGYEEVWNKTMMEFRSPRDIAGTKKLTIVYLKHDREDDGWIYMPSQRKPRRVLGSERTGELLGMDMIMDDAYGFGGKTFEHNWSYLGKKKILVTINVPNNPELGGPNLWVPHKTRWEIRDCHVVLLTPISPSHPYEHKVVLIDADTYWTMYSFGFDRDDHLLRFMQGFRKYSETFSQEQLDQPPYMALDYTKNLGKNVLIHVGETDVNVQKPHATVTHAWVMHKDFTSGRAKQFYSVRNMVSGRR